MKRLGKYIRPYVLYIGLTLLIKLIGAAAELLIPYLMEMILDDIVPQGNVPLLLQYGGGCFCARCAAWD